MKVTVIGAGNSGMAMAAHLSNEGNQVILWNRSLATISRLKENPRIRCEGIINGYIPINKVTNDINLALFDPDVVLITTPADSHRDLAELIAKNIVKSTVIVLNPGRTFGALEFRNVYQKYNQIYEQVIAETQTIIYTCRKTDADAVNIIAFKNAVLIASLDNESNNNVIHKLPECLRGFLKPAQSMIQTSIGNVGMILHCAPLLLNAGWTESEYNIYKYYYEGITTTIGSLIEKIDWERVAVSETLGSKVESTKEWLIRTYNTFGNDLYECIQNNEAYKTIDAPLTLKHRYIFEDVPCGLVPLEAIGLRMGLKMEYTTLVIDLACKLLDFDFRKSGRNLENLGLPTEKKDIISLFKEKDIL